MPTPEQILAGLTRLANDFVALAVVWHALALAAAGALALGWRPPRRLVAALLVLSLLSVAALGWTGGNPFNGAVFTLVAAVLGLMASNWRAARSMAGAPWRARIVGAGLLGFGWVYPHFVEVGTPLAYLYAAPLGVVPCATLSAVVGVSLLADGLGSRAWAAILGVVGLFYGAFGVFRLGVSIDLVLLVGSVALLERAFLLRAERPPQSTANPSA